MILYTARLAAVDAESISLLYSYLYSGSFLNFDISKSSPVSFLNASLNSGNQVDRTIIGSDDAEDSLRYFSASVGLRISDPVMSMCLLVMAFNIKGLPRKCM